MICQNCAEAAAANGEVRRDMLHRRCTGCPCQHREPARPRLLARIVGSSEGTVIELPPERSFPGFTTPFFVPEDRR